MVRLREKYHNIIGCCCCCCHENNWHIMSNVTTASPPLPRIFVTLQKTSSTPLLNSWTKHQTWWVFMSKVDSRLCCRRSHTLLLTLVDRLEPVVVAFTAAVVERLAEPQRAGVRVPYHVVRTATCLLCWLWTYVYIANNKLTDIVCNYSANSKPRNALLCIVRYK